MSENISKEDLRQFGLILMDSFRQMIQKALPAEKQTAEPQWLKSRVVRKLMDVSPGTLQNLRVTGQIRFKKVMGSYYYSKADLDKLFKE
jgi:hypothetical protein